MLELATSKFSSTTSGSRTLYACQAQRWRRSPRRAGPTAVKDFCRWRRHPHSTLRRSRRRWQPVAARQTNTRGTSSQTRPSTTRPPETSWRMESKFWVRARWKRYRLIWHRGMAILGRQSCRQDTNKCLCTVHRLRGSHRVYPKWPPECQIGAEAANSAGRPRADWRTRAWRTRRIRRASEQLISGKKYHRLI